MYKAIDKWLAGYLRSVFSRPKSVKRPLHVMFALVDHFEPCPPITAKGLKAGMQKVDRWVKEFPPLVKSFVDYDGHRPKHTFFFPAEKYHRDYLEGLADICGSGFGEVEIHLHHDNDTEAGFRQKLSRFRDLLHLEHGFLGRDFKNRPRYAFIHGNWTLCNSHPQGKLCGVDNELHILQETGCYVDMTMPSGVTPTQTRTVNSIYYAGDIPGRPRSHDYGIPVSVMAACGHDYGLPVSAMAACGAKELGHGQQRAARGITRAGGWQTGKARKPAVGWAQAASPEDGLMLIQGPLALNWAWRKWGVLPRFEHADIRGSSPPGPQRVDLWVRQHIHVLGRPEWIFIKVHTHGCQEANMKLLLGASLKDLYRYLNLQYNDRRNFCLHYVSAREMYNIVKAAEAGAKGNPGEFRDFEIQAPKISGKDF